MLLWLLDLSRSLESTPISSLSDFKKEEGPMEDFDEDNL